MSAIQDQIPAIYAVGIAAALAIIAVFVTFKWRASARARAAQALHVANLEEKYRPILNIDRAVAESEKRLAEAESAFQAQELALDKTIADLKADHAKRLAEAEGAFQAHKSALDKTVADLKADYVGKKQIYDRLSHETASLEDRLDFAELGIYKPTFQLNDSAHYAIAIEANIAKQKHMISEGTAIIAETKWTVDGSEAKGRTMTNRAIRMTLRAFNNECEVIVSKATWKNFQQMEDRIRKSQSTLDNLNESNRVRISGLFVGLKLEELRLTHEERLKRREEQEKLREEREKEREEAKAQRELDAEVRRAEAKEEQRREALMEARAELRAAGEAEKAMLAAKIADLEATLSAAHAATERAMSMAQQTKVGYVYVISNLGAFGENVFKIGMTRRLEPLDRVRELGDASVPFPFDVHALIFTEDAPALERSLQVELDPHRVNRVNPRKEFFRVPPDELKAKVLARFADVVYLDRPEAEEYLQSLPKAEIESMAATEREEAFPAAI